MRLLLAGLLTVFAAVSAIAQELPQSVADAYRGYEAAVDEENFDAAAAFAREAWRAAEANDVATETTVILAANYGEVALMTGSAVGAAEAYGRAIELSSTMSRRPSEYAFYLLQSAIAQRSLQDHRQAIEFAEQAINAYAAMPDEETRYAGLYQANLVGAYAADALERYRQSGRFAEAGMAALGYFGPVSNPNVAQLSFLAGMQAYRRGDRVNALYYLIVARLAAGQFQMDQEFRETALHLQQVVMVRTNPIYFDEVFDRIRASGYEPQRCYFVNSCPDEPGPEYVDGHVPLLRTPPDYPDRAARSCVEGYVDVVFRVNVEGRTENITVAEATDDDFVPPAIRAVEQWRFWPREIDRQLRAQDGVMTRLEFVMAEGECD
ncbi:TonB family protein [Hyphobacterium sp.]|uniref:TonB family protein n=1 Tax=Hyphobacterium sp. TaxID=2004662 RepID=UPI003BACDC12